MSSDILEVLDANIVILPEEPLTQAINAVSLFEGKGLTSLVRKPLTMAQGFIFDAALGATTGMYQFESMRSQKTINLSSVRIEVHDRSGEANLETARLPETMMALANVLHIEHIKAIGANWVTSFRSANDIPASTMIAEKLLRQDISFLPSNMKLTGGSASIFLKDDAGVQYTLGIEPRGQSSTTDEFGMTCNANISSPEALSIELLKEMFQQSYRLLFEVKESLFPLS